MSGRGYGDYFSTIRSVQMQTGGERGLHGACSVGQYLGWMGWGVARNAGGGRCDGASGKAVLFPGCGVMWEGVV